METEARASVRRYVVNVDFEISAVDEENAVEMVATALDTATSTPFAAPDGELNPLADFTMVRVD
jgi:hypothetical protein